MSPNRINKLGRTERNFISDATKDAIRNEILSLHEGSIRYYQDFEYKYTEKGIALSTDHFENIHTGQYIHSSYIIKNNK